MNRSDPPKKPPSGTPSPDSSGSHESPVSRLRSSVAFLTDRNAGRSASPDESVSILDGDWNNRVHKRKHFRTGKTASTESGPGSAVEKTEFPRTTPGYRLKRLMAKFFR